MSKQRATIFSDSRGEVRNCFVAPRGAIENNVPFRKVDCGKAICGQTGNEKTKNKKPKTIGQTMLQIDERRKRNCCFYFLLLAIITVLY